MTGQQTAVAEARRSFRAILMLGALSLASLGAAPAAADSPATCTTDLALIAQSGAMVDLGLLAPCHGSERVVIRHAGIVVTGQTSEAGTLIASLPAFSSPAEVTIAFADGSTVSGTVEIPDLTGLDRFAVQWMEGDAFSLHALPEGADYDSAAHLSSTNPGKPSEEGNFLSLLGDPAAERPLMAEVYTWPRGTRAGEGGITFLLEAAVTPQSCGRDMPAETLELRAGVPQVRELSISMPDCSATGEFLVLPNPLSPEKISTN